MTQLLTRTCVVALRDQILRTSGCGAALIHQKEHDLFIYRDYSISGLSGICEVLPQVPVALTF